MPAIHSVSKINFPDKISQDQVKKTSRELFAPSFPNIDRYLEIFDNTDIKYRNFCLSLVKVPALNSFEKRNAEYVRIALEYSVKAIEDVIKKADIKKNEITDFIFVSSTGLATPSLDALIINKLRLNQDINRTPIFGLGCAGGVSGVAKANTVAKANPDAIVLLVAVELCSLTFLQNDFSKSNFVASSLFSDGVAACIIKGDSHSRKNKNVTFKASESKLYYDSLDVMGWDFLDSGFKVVFSQDIPTIIHQNVKEDVTSFLSKHQLELKDIRNFIFHPGGKKVLSAYEDALKLDNDSLHNSREVIQNYGNMSSATVLYVLEKFMTEGYQKGYGLMLALGPGFSSEMVLLEMN